MESHTTPATAGMPDRRYWTVLYTADTWKTSAEHGFTVMGFTAPHEDGPGGYKQVVFDRVSAGDYFLCYVTGEMKWTGVLRVESGSYLDAEPVWGVDNDGNPRFPVRFRVSPLVTVELADGIPRDDGYESLALMTDGAKRGFFSMGLREVAAEDGEALLQRLQGAEANRVWWVNQGNSWTRESMDGFLFSPMHTKKGAKRVYWTAMTHVRTGDRIIHYANGFMKAVSVVTAEAVVAERPARSEDEGYLVWADYTLLTPELPLSSIPLDVRLAAPKDGPFDVNGEIKEGYLWPISAELAAEIASACPSVGELLARPAANVPAVVKPPGNAGAPHVPLDLDWLAQMTNWQKAELEELCDAVTGASPQVVLSGPPGTSKTWVAKQLVRFLTQDDPLRSRIIQFHPTYGYEEFMEGLRPVADEGAIRFEREDGVVLAYVKEISTAKEAKPCFLLIDEMNRANLSRVLGELMYLFEYRDDAIDLRYTKGWKLPANLKFVGTMNTADRSIRSIDIALRRRFDVFECQPDASILERFYAKAENEVSDLIEGFNELNQRLEETLDRHHTIGHAFFMASPMTAVRLRAIWDRKIGPLIEEYFFDQPDIATSFTLSRFWPSIGDAH